ncbi:MAG: methyltransferase domain-containing protein [Anaerolineae bacterium]|nr:methyltransferase domain-containing protein [Anaerolineae bacterium]
MDIKRVSERWDDNEWTAGIPSDYWSSHPIIDAYIYATIIPHAIDMSHWLGHTILKDTPCERAISVCSGLGTMDRPALAAGVCHQLEGFDVSPASVKFAQEEAEKAGYGDRVHYWVADANTVVLEKNRYDLAISLGGIHHVTELERLCDQLKYALKPDSYIFVNEFIGPSHLQWTEEQLEIINRVMSILPPSWRRAEQVSPLPLQDMIANDPSEAVRANEVISILQANFETVDYCDYGGGMLMPLWASGIIPDVFFTDLAIDKQVIIKLLILLDELLAEHNIVPSNYAQLVLRNRPPSSDRKITRRLSVHSSDRSRWIDKWLYPPHIPTPWWHLPSKAGQVLWYEGGKALIEQIQNYIRWLRIRSKKQGANHNR